MLQSDLGYPNVQVGCDSGCDIKGTFRDMIYRVRSQGVGGVGLCVMYAVRSPPSPLSVTVFHRLGLDGAHG